MRTLLLSALVGVIALACLLNSVDSRPVSLTETTDRGEIGKALARLVEYGYLAKSSSGGDSGGGGSLNSPAVIKAIKDVQRFGNLAVTGIPNSETLALINGKRCGLKDPVKKLGTTGSLIGEYYLQGTYWRKKDLTFCFRSFTSDLPVEDQKNILPKMMQKWAAASTLTITEKAVCDDDVDIVISFVRRNHGDPYPFDGQGGTLAHAFYPHNNKGLSGDAHFDDDEKFTTETSDGINLDWVAIHEFGHSMGLQHSNVRESIMYPWYKGYKKDIELTNDDIQGIQALYGKPTQTKPTQKPTPKPPKPEGHPACKPETSYDAVVVIGEDTHFFSGDYFWTLSTKQLERGDAKKVTEYWPDAKTPINAAYRNKRGNVVFFSGSRFWEYNNKRQLVNSGSISDYGLSSNLANMDAVFTWKKNGRTYIFKGSQYWRYNEKTHRMDGGYPKNIQAGWPDLPNDIDAAVTWLNGRSYIFNGKDYLRLKNYSQRRKVYVDRGYPKETARGWMKCRADTGAIGALGSFP